MKPTIQNSIRKNVTPLLQLGAFLYRHRFTIADGLEIAAEVLRNWPPKFADSTQTRKSPASAKGPNRLSKPRIRANK